CNREPNRQAFSRGNIQRLVTLGLLAFETLIDVAGREHVCARVIERHGFKRGFEVDSGIERGWFSPGNLADKNCRVSRWDNVERSSQQQEHETGSADVPSKTGAQLEFRFSKFFGSTLGFFDSPTSADVVVN